MNPLHARIPLNYVSRNTWLNLSVDLSSFCSFCFKGSTYRTLETLILCSHCKMRKVFTMRSPLLDVNEEGDGPSMPVETLPKSVEFPAGVIFSNQVYSADKIGVDNSNDENVPACASQMLVEGTKVPKTVQLAFGSRVGKGGAKIEETDKKRHQAQSTIEDASHSNDKSMMHETTNDTLKAQNTISGTGTVTPIRNMKKSFVPPKATRNARKDPVQSCDQRPKVTYNTLEFRHPREAKPAARLQVRDASEPPLDRSARKRRSKESPRRSQATSTFSATRNPKDAEDRPKGQQAKEKECWVQGEDHKDGTKRRTFKTTRGSGSTGPDETANKGGNKRGGRMVKKATNKAGDKKKLGCRQSFEDAKVDLQRKGTVTKMLDEPVGGAQLNSYNIKVDEGQKETEIEEVIEADEKPSAKDDLSDSPSPLQIHTVDSFHQTAQCAADKLRAYEGTQQEGDKDAGMQLVGRGQQDSDSGRGGGRDGGRSQSQCG